MASTQLVRFVLVGNNRFDLVNLQRRQNQQAEACCGGRARNQHKEKEAVLGERGGRTRLLLALAI